jgi:hypothetical protein
MTIQAPHYKERERQLTADPHVQQMAEDIRLGIEEGVVARSDLFHPDSEQTPRHSFMLSANQRYHHLSGGQSGGHLGAVPNAIRMILDKEND